MNFRFTESALGTVAAVRGLQIVPWRPDHETALHAGLEAPDELTLQSRHRHGADVPGPHWGRTLVAEEGGRAVGVASVFVSRWHPERLWCSVEVASPDRRRGIGTALLGAAMKISRDDGRPLRGKVFAGSPGAHFTEAHGFRILQRSRTFRLDSGALTPPARFPVEHRAKPDEAAAAFLQFYVRTHTWDPPGDLSTADVRASHIDEAAETLLVRDNDGSVVAVGCLYEEPDGLLLSGGSTEDGPSIRAATAVLLDAAIISARSLGRPLLVEADDAASDLVDELLIRSAAVVDEVHIVASG